MTSRCAIKSKRSVTTKPPVKAYADRPRPQSKFQIFPAQLRKITCHHCAIAPEKKLTSFRVARKTFSLMGRTDGCFAITRTRAF